MPHRETLHRREPIRATRVRPFRFCVNAAIQAVIAVTTATIGVPAATAGAPAPAQDATPLRADRTPEDEQRRKELVTVPDEIQPENPFAFDVFGRPLTVSGSLNSKVESIGNTSLDIDPDDRVRVREELGLDLYYQLTDSISIYLEGKYRYTWEPYREDGDTKSNNEFRRGQTWVNADHLFGTPFGFRVGRQLFDDDRSWWWSKKLDAARVFLETDTVRADLAFAQEIAESSSDDSSIDADEEDLWRILGSAGWQYHPKHRIGMFFLHQNDSSDTESVGDIVSEDDEDDLDGDLTWAGLRAQGQWRVRKVGKFDYWVDGAVVAGHEDEIDYDSTDSGDSEVDTVSSRDVLGFAFDTGVTWETRWPCEPYFTVQYAFGSGDNGSSGTDGNYRQSDLQINKARFDGERRVNYYGRALDPQISNLHIATFGLGFPLFEDSSIDFLYHYYHQVESADLLRSEGLDVDPLGMNGSIGHGIDAVLAIDEWEYVEIDLIGSGFRAGSAFGPEAGTWAWRGILEVKFAF